MSDTEYDPYTGAGWDEDASDDELERRLKAWIANYYRNGGAS